MDDRRIGPLLEETRINRQTTRSVKHVRAGASSRQGLAAPGQCERKIHQSFRSQLALSSRCFCSWILRSKHGYGTDIVVRDDARFCLSFVSAKYTQSTPTISCSRSTGQGHILQARERSLCPANQRFVYASLLHLWLHTSEPIDFHAHL